MPEGGFASADHHLAALTELGVTSDFLPDLPGQLAAATFAPRLAHLEISGREAEPARWAALWGATSLSGLRRFAFRAGVHRLEDSISLRDLLAAPWLADLDRLTLTGWVGHQPLGARRPPFLSQLLRAAPRLRGLSLDGCPLPPEEADALRGIPAVSLEHLDLGSGMGVGRKVLRAVLQCPALAGLRSFALSSAGCAALHYLTESPLRHGLRVLRLTECRPTSLLRLARAGCRSLERLAVGVNLRSQGTGEDGEASLAPAFAALLDPDNLPRLASLRVTCYGSVTAVLLRALARAPGVTRLKELDLELCAGPAEVTALAELPLSDGLARLAIGHVWAKDTVERQANVAVLQERFGPALDCGGPTCSRPADVGELC
jgi:hypothetical protein